MVLHKMTLVAALLFYQAGDCVLAASPESIADPQTSPGNNFPSRCTEELPVKTAPLELTEAIDLALCNNPKIQAAWMNIRIQASALERARSTYWPTLYANATELTDRSSYPGTQISTTTRTETTVYGSFVWRLFDFGGRAANQRSAQALLESAEASRDAVIQSTLRSVIQTYFGGITDKASLANKVEDRGLAQSSLQSAQRRLALGAVGRTDVLQATTALSKAALDESRARGEYEKSVAILVYAIGLPPGTVVELPADVDQRTGFEEEDLRTWLKETELRHPAIIAARTAAESAHEQVTVAQVSSRPTLDFTGDYYENGYPSQGLTSTNSRVTTFGLSVTVPLFDGFATRAKVRGAEAAAKVKDAELQQTEQETLMEVVKAHAQAQASLRNLRASEDLIQAARESMESSQRRYASGAASIMELLSTQTALEDARTERMRCLVDWRTARLTLLATAGILNRESIAH